MIYNDKVISLSKSDPKAEFISWEDFLQLTKPVIPLDYEKECTPSKSSYQINRDDH